jgi:hypothetical protein
MSMVGATAEHPVSAMPWLTDANTLDNAKWRQHGASAFKKRPSAVEDI